MATEREYHDISQCNLEKTKYDLTFVFVIVRTNVGYKYFIVQSESTEQILEALNVFKQWNPDWKPAFFHCDYSEAEISSIQLYVTSTQGPAE